MDNSELEQQPAPLTPANGRRRLVVIVVIVAIAASALIYWILGLGKITTDDAQVEGHLVPISSRVNGYVDSILVEDNQHVRAGDLLVKLDSRDMEARVRQAEANLAAARAQAKAAAEQLGVTELTAPAAEREAGAGVSAAMAEVESAKVQVAVAQHRASAARAEACAAEEAVENARRELEAVNAQVDAAEAAYLQSQANVKAAQADAKRAHADADRYRRLYQDGAASSQQLDAAESAESQTIANLEAARERVEAAKAGIAQAKARREGAKTSVAQSMARLAAARESARQAAESVGVARASVGSAQAELLRSIARKSAATSATRQIAVGKAQTQTSIARIKQAEADLRTARLQLSYTRITAPVDGVVSKKVVQLGQSVQPGQQLLALVPLEDVWVVANFKETQIRRMKRGQRASVKVDTYPGLSLEGIVDSIGAATGAKFSLLPPENATGNYVKVVQRIPVKIVIKDRLPKGIVLRPGMNVVATVYL